MSDTGFTAAPPPPEDYTPRYCLRCQSPLRSYQMESPCCSRCFLPFDPTDPATYSPRVSGLRWELWLPAWALAVLAGVVAYTFIWWSGELGVAISCPVPEVEHRCHAPGVWLDIGVESVRSAAPRYVVFMGLHGVFCGASAVFGSALFGYRRLHPAANSARYQDNRRNYFIGLFLLTSYAGSGSSTSSPPGDSRRANRHGLPRWITRNLESVAL